MGKLLLTEEAMKNEISSKYNDKELQKKIDFYFKTKKYCYDCIHYQTSSFCGYDHCSCAVYGSLDMDQNERHPDITADICKDYKNSGKNSAIRFVYRYLISYPELKIADSLIGPFYTAKDKCLTKIDDFYKSKEVKK